MRKRLPFFILSAPAAAIVPAAALAPVLAPRDPLKTESASRLRPPGTQFRDGTRALLGTDQVGRDILSRIVYGGRVSLTVGFFAVAVAGAIGVLTGLVAGYYRGWLEVVLMRLADIQLGFPGILLAIAITAVLGPSVTSLVISLGITRWVAYAWKRPGRWGRPTASCSAATSFPRSSRPCSSWPPSSLAG